MDERLSITRLLLLVVSISLLIICSNWVYRFGWNLCYVTKTGDVSTNIVEISTCQNEPLFAANASKYAECNDIHLVAPNVDFDCVTVKQCKSPANLDQQCRYLCRLHGIVMSTAKSDIEYFGWDASKLSNFGAVNTTWKGSHILQDGYHIPLNVYLDKAFGGGPFVLVNPDFSFWEEIRQNLVTLICAVTATLAFVAFPGGIQQHAA